jgi:hypothetical protein
LDPIFLEEPIFLLLEKKGGKQAFLEGLLPIWAP